VWCMADHLELLPAVDVQGGRAVQLDHGITGSEKVLGDPVEAALNWQERGAQWVHLVDVDAAFDRGNNRALLAEIVGRLDIGVEVSGGIRDISAATDRPLVASGGISGLADLEALQGMVANGVEGAIIGTALYERRFTLEDALALTLPRGGPGGPG